MASSRASLLPCRLSMVAVFVCLFVLLPYETEAKSCVVGCMRQVLTCKRKASLAGSGGDLCCQQYYECFMECKPSAKKLPPCNNGVGKRSMWLQEDDRQDQERLPSFADFF
ncbi:hypothetical protein ACOMHN_030740 [Nucella lapillus]